MENAKTGSKYSFKCGRWLSLKEDDKSTIRELPAIGEGIVPLPGNIYSDEEQFSLFKLFIISLVLITCSVTCYGQSINMHDRFKS